MSKEKKRKLNEDKEKEGLVYFEIWGIFMILIAIVLLSELGPVGRTLNLLVKIIFGDWYWLILCFLFYYGTLMIIYHEFITYTSIKIKGIIFLSSGLLIYTHFPLYYYLKATIALNSSNIITESYNVYLSYINVGDYSGIYGGGLLGAALLWTSMLLLGEIGTKILAIILLISGVAYLFEKTVYDFIDDLYFGLIHAYKNIKKQMKSILTTMQEASQHYKTNDKKLVEEVIPTDETTSKFESMNTTRIEKIEIPKGKYSKPNLKLLKTHENKQVLENQKEITVQKAKVINEFLKAFLLNLEISEIYLGPTISTFVIDVDNSIKSKKIINYKQDLMTRLESKEVRIYERYDQKHSVVIELPNQFRYYVSLKEILEEDHEETLIPIGRDYMGKIFYLDFLKNANTLVIGNDIESKIDFLKLIVNVILYKFDPKDFKLVLCDSTKYELNQFASIPHLFYNFVSEFQSIKPMLIKLYTEVEQRLNQLNSHVTKFTPILLILNDFVDFYLNNNDYLKYLNYVIVYGGKVGIYTLFSTNNMDEKILTNNLKAQFDSIISFMIHNFELSFKYLEDDATKLLKEGDCLIYSRTVHTSTRVQLVNLTEDDSFV